MPGLARRRIEDEQEIADSQPASDMNPAQVDEAVAASEQAEAVIAEEAQAQPDEQAELDADIVASDDVIDRAKSDDDEADVIGSDTLEADAEAGRDDDEEEDDDDEEDDSDDDERNVNGAEDDADDDDDDAAQDSDDGDDDDDDSDEDDDEEDEDEDEDDDARASAQSDDASSEPALIADGAVTGLVPEAEPADDEAVSDSQQTPQGRPDEMRILEALLFASKEPIDEKTLAQRLPAGVELQPVLTLLREEYAHRGVNLVRVNGKWTFRTASDLAWLMTREAIQPRKLSRAAVETLAVIAYHQPVTRAEIEDIRGVSISKGTLDVLLETGWIKPRGRRKVPGRPITYGTTEAFISHFGLEQLGDLPGLDELKGSGMLEGHLPPNFSVPIPSDDPTLREDEDPLEPGDLDFGLAPRPENTEE